MKYSKLLMGLILMVGVSALSCKKHSDSPTDKTLTSQPGPNNGQDCMVGYRDGDNNAYAANNMNHDPDLTAARWTWAAEGAGEGTLRAYFKFPELSQISQNAVIKSAKLSLYGLTSGTAILTGNSVYTGSPYASSGSNRAWLKRVTANWDEATITWNNKPASTDANQVEIPESNAQWNYNVIDLDVTQMVKDMVTNKQNYGFVMQLQTEQIYRALGFSSSESGDANKRPKLVVVYQ